MTPAPLTPEKTRQFAIVLWIAMVASIGMYFLIANVVPRTAANPASPLPVPFLAIAIAAVLASVFFRTRLGVGEDGRRPLAMVRAGYLMAFVFCESAALLGLVLYFVAGWPKYWVLFLIAALGFAINFPSREDFELA